MITGSFVQWFWKDLCVNAVENTLTTSYSQMQLLHQ